MEKSYHDGMLDISLVEDIEVKISQLHPSLLPVLHVNTKKGCVLRICMIMGEITIEDLRNDNKKDSICDSEPKEQIL